MQANFENGGTVLEASVDALLNLAIESLTYGKSMRNAMAKDLGKQLGLDIARHLSPINGESLIESLSELWRRNGFGEIRWLDGEKMLLHSTPYVDIVFPHQLVSRHCAFKEGILEAVLQRLFENEIVVKEMSHSSIPNESCIFKIGILKLIHS
jgi:predicted hydrocarbon binding protein